MGSLKQSHSPAWHTSGGCIQKLLLVHPGTQRLLPLPGSPTAGATTQGGPGHFLDRSLVCASPSCLQADPWLLLPTRASFSVQYRGSKGSPLPLTGSEGLC